MATAARPRIDVTVRLDRAMSARVDDILNALKARGLTDVAAHTRFMIVNGSIAPDQLDALLSVAGVQSVREDATYRAQG